MGLVSALYRMAPSEAQPSPQELDQRLERVLTRLISIYGGDEVRGRIRESNLATDSLKARLVLLALTTPRETMRT